MGISWPGARFLLYYIRPLIIFPDFDLKRDFLRAFLIAVVTCGSYTDFDLVCLCFQALLDRDLAVLGNGDLLVTGQLLLSDPYRIWTQRARTDNRYHRRLHRNRWL